MQAKTIQSFIKYVFIQRSVNLYTYEEYVHDAWFECNFVYMF